MYISITEMELLPLVMLKLVPYADEQKNLCQTDARIKNVYNI